MAITPSIERPHEFGPGVIWELATRLFKNPISAFREAVSNALDASLPYERQGIPPKVHIYTNNLPDGDVIIEDFGTGIEDFNNFTIISPGYKQVKDQVSSSEEVNKDIIGGKGIGKLSFLNLSNEHRVELFSNNRELGNHIIMTMNKFTEKHMNSELALPHHGLKIVIKKARRISESRLKETLSKTFALRIADGAQIFLNNEQIQKPEGFDPRPDKLFDLKNGIPVYGNLKDVSESKSNNIQITIKRVLVEEKDFHYILVEGWLNCDYLELRTDRDGILEGNDLYTEFYQKLRQHLEKNFQRTSVNKEISIKKQKQIKEIFSDIVYTIHHLHPNMETPLMYGNTADDKGIGANSDPGDDAASDCTVYEGFILDPTKTAEPVTAKPIGQGKGHKLGNGESSAKIINGDGKILAPSASSVLITNNNMMMPRLKVAVSESGGKPIVFFDPPNRLVINSDRPSSKIILDAANAKDLNDMKSRVLPLLVRAGTEAFPESSEMSKSEYHKLYDQVLDIIWSK